MDYKNITNKQNSNKLDPICGLWGAPIKAPPSSRCRSPMMLHSHSDGEFPLYQKGD